MKQFLLSAIFCISIPFIASAQTGENHSKGMELKVHIKGLTGGSCMLANHYGDQQYIQDTVKVDANGNMVFRDTASKLGGIYLVVLPSKKYFEIVITDVQHFSIETDTADLVRNMKFIGSNENKYFYEYLNYMNDCQKQMEPIQHAMKATKNKDSIAMLQKKVAAMDSVVKIYKRDYYKKKHPETFMAEVLAAMDEPDQIPYSACPKKADGTIDSSYNYWNFRNHYWDGMNFTDDRMMRTPVYVNKLKFYLDKLIPQTPDSIIAAADWLVNKTRPSKELFKYTVFYCTNTYETAKIMGFDAIFVHMAETYYATNQAFWMSPEQNKKVVDRAKQLKFTLLGQPAYNMAFRDTAYRIHSLNAIKADYTVVIFWDPSCSHCKKEVPLLKAYYDSLHKAGVSFEVYAVVSEMDSIGWKNYIKENKLTWINVAARKQEDLSNIKYYYDVYLTPTIYLLDKNKKIIGKRLDVDGLRGFLDHQIKEDKKKATVAPTPSSTPTPANKPN